MSIKRVLLLVALVFALVPLSALADTLDFSIVAPGSNSAGGSVSYAGGASPLVGTNIVVDAVTDLTTGVVFDLSDGPGTAPGILSFTTGANTGGWNFGAGGSISITASCIDSDVDDGDLCVDDTVASGALGANTFLLGTVDSASVAFSGNVFHVALVLASDQKDANLLALFGITPPSGWVAGTNLSFLTAGNASTGDAFTSSQIGSGDVINIPAVPEPGSLLLLGSGLLSVGGYLRRRILAV